MKCNDIGGTMIKRKTSDKGMPINQDYTAAFLTFVTPIERSIPRLQIGAKLIKTEMGKVVSFLHVRVFVVICC